MIPLAKIENKKPKITILKILTKRLDSAEKMIYDLKMRITK